MAPGFLCVVCEHTHIRLHALGSRPRVRCVARTGSDTPLKTLRRFSGLSTLSRSHPKRRDLSAFGA